MGKYRLIITEKPDAANRIAMALDEDGKAKKMFDVVFLIIKHIETEKSSLYLLSVIYTLLLVKKKQIGITQFLIIDGFQDIWPNEGPQKSVFG